MLMLKYFLNNCDTNLLQYPPYSEASIEPRKFKLFKNAFLDCIDDAEKLFISDDLEKLFIFGLDNEADEYEKQVNCIIKDFYNVYIDKGENYTFSIIKLIVEFYKKTVNMSITNKKQLVIINDISQLQGNLNDLLTPNVVISYNECDIIYRLSKYYIDEEDSLVNELIDEYCFADYVDHRVRHFYNNKKKTIKLYLHNGYKLIISIQDKKVIDYSVEHDNEILNPVNRLKHYNNEDYRESNYLNTLNTTYLFIPPSAIERKLKTKKYFKDIYDKFLEQVKNIDTIEDRTQLIKKTIIDLTHINILLNIDNIDDIIPMDKLNIIGIDGVKFILENLIENPDISYLVSRVIWLGCRFSLDNPSIQYYLKPILDIFVLNNKER